MKIRGIYLIPFTLALLATAASACESPSVIAREFFRNDYAFAFREPRTVISRLSSQFYRLLEAESACRRRGGSCAIDWDPWTGAQDGSVIGEPTTVVVLDSQLLSKVQLSFVFDAGPQIAHSTRQAVVVLRRSSPAACWKIDDLVTDQAGSLKGLIQASAKKKLP